MHAGTQAAIRVVVMRTRTLAELNRNATERTGTISFAGGLPDPETFPKKALAQTASQATLGLADASLAIDPQGREGLRWLVAMRLAQRGAQVDPDDVHLTNGAQEALHLALEVLEPSTVQVDHATSPCALDVLDAVGAHVVSATHQPVRFVMPAISNPYGWQMTPDERALALQAQWLIEDDAHAELHFEGEAPRPLIADAPDRVFHIGTVSKTLSPGLRIGWLVSPRAWREKVRAAKARHDSQPCNIAQAMVETMLASGDFDERLGRLRGHYQARADALLAELPKLHGVRFSMPRGGFSVWLETDLPGDDRTLLEHALLNGVSFDPGRYFRPPDVHRRGLAIRLGFSSVPVEHVAEGVRRLAKTLDEQRTWRRRNTTEISVAA